MHTKGPWTIQQAGYESFILGPRGRLASVYESDRPTEEERANARLIAAAPELLECCKRVLAMWEWCLIEGGAHGPLAPHLITELATMQQEICGQILTAIEKAERP